MIEQLPIHLNGGGKMDLRCQFSALCYRPSAHGIEFLLVTSRGSGRWIIPKGWPMDGMTPAQAAQREAWEEAGVVGETSNQCAGVYSYAKSTDRHGVVPCLSLVFPLKVSRLEGDFPEAGQRTAQWVSADEIEDLIDDPELAWIIKNFDPSSFTDAF